MNTQLSLLDLSPEPLTASMRLTKRAAVYDWFTRHPDMDIDGLALAKLGGAYAWRTRVSECRKLGLQIINTQIRRDDGSVRSLYRYSTKEAA